MFTFAFPIAHSGEPPSHIKIRAGKYAGHELSPNEVEAFGLVESIQVAARLFPREHFESTWSADGLSRDSKGQRGTSAQLAGLLALLERRFARQPASTDLGVVWATGGLRHGRGVQSVDHASFAKKVEAFSTADARLLIAPQSNVVTLQIPAGVRHVDLKLLVKSAGSSSERWAREEKWIVGVPEGTQHLARLVESLFQARVAATRRVGFREFALASVIIIALVIGGVFATRSPVPERTERGGEQKAQLSAISEQSEQLSSISCFQILSGLRDEEPGSLGVARSALERVPSKVLRRRCVDQVLATQPRSISQLMFVLSAAQGMDSNGAAIAEAIIRTSEAITKSLDIEEIAKRYSTTELGQAFVRDYRTKELELLDRWFEQLPPGYEVASGLTGKGVEDVAATLRPWFLLDRCARHLPNRGDPALSGDAVSRPTSLPGGAAAEGMSKLLSRTMGGRRIWMLPDDCRFNARGYRLCAKDQKPGGVYENGLCPLGECKDGFCLEVVDKAMCKDYVIDWLFDAPAREGMLRFRESCVNSPSGVFVVADRYQGRSAMTLSFAGVLLTVDEMAEEGLDVVYLPFRGGASTFDWIGPIELWSERVDGMAIFRALGRADRKTPWRITSQEKVKLGSGVLVLGVRDRAWDLLAIGAVVRREPKNGIRIMPVYCKRGWDVGQLTDAHLIVTGLSDAHYLAQFLRESVGLEKIHDPEELMRMDGCNSVKSKEEYSMARDLLNLWLRK